MTDSTLDDTQKQEAIRLLFRVVYTEPAEDNDACMVCDDAVGTELSCCKYRWCDACMVQWINVRQRNNKGVTCPMCRTAVIPNDISATMGTVTSPPVIQPVEMAIPAGEIELTEVVEPTEESRIDRLRRILRDWSGNGNYYLHTRLTNVRLTTRTQEWCKSQDTFEQFRLALDMFECPQLYDNYERLWKMLMKSICGYIRIIFTQRDGTSHPNRRTLQLGRLSHRSQITCNVKSFVVGVCTRMAIAEYYNQGIPDRVEHGEIEQTDDIRVKLFTKYQVDTHYMYTRTVTGVNERRPSLVMRVPVVYSDSPCTVCGSRRQEAKYIKFLVSNSNSTPNVDMVCPSYQSGCRTCQRDLARQLMAAHKEIQEHSRLLYKAGRHIHMALGKVAVNMFANAFRWGVFHPADFLHTPPHARQRIIYPVEVEYDELASSDDESDY